MNSCVVIRVDGNSICRCVFKGCGGSNCEFGSGAMNGAIKVVSSKKRFKHSFPIAMIARG